MREMALEGERTCLDRCVVVSDVVIGGVVALVQCFVG
jgi:hypothetical protein